MMKAYPEYIDSAIEGVDKIPSNWNVMRFRHLFSIGRGLGITKENLQDDGIPCVNYGEIHSKYGFELDLEKHPLKCVHEGYLESSPSSLLNKGDLVYADTSEDLEGSGNFTQLVSDEKTFAGYHTVIARQTRNHDDRFLAYALDSDYCRNQIRRMVKGVKVFSITQAILKDTSILLPSYDEQKSISSFLDVNTSRIDNLIAEKESFIKLLSEKRQALISHVVTKGLNPNIEIKEVPFTKYLSEQSDYRGKTPNKTDSGILLVTARNIKMGFIDYECSKEYIAETDYNEVMRRGLPKFGDILFTTEAPLGNVALVDNENIALAQRVIRFRTNESYLNSEYTVLLMQSDYFQNQIKQLAQGITAQGIKASKLNQLKVYMPSLEEQSEIVQYVKDKNSRIDALVNETNKSIEFLKEHRTALICAAVTGKIDVREEV